jgi:hypothetical protein
MKMLVAAKKLATYLKVEMKPLSRCARAVFTYQLHRRRMYGVVICGSEATTVRFDRAEILSSPQINVRNQLDFTPAFASLMMLDPEAFGYDMAFSTRPGQDGQM